jgi:hypothetical protein
MRRVRRIFPLLGLLLVIALSGALAVFLKPFFLLVLGGVLVVAIIAASLSMSHAAYVAVCMFVLTITWNGLRFGGGAIANAFFAIATIAVVGYIARERPAVPIPGWLFTAGAGFCLAVAVVLFFPTDPGLHNEAELQARRILDSSGQYLAVGTRSDLLTLAQFLLALVWIPVMLATIATTVARVLRLLDLWTISAVVCAAVGIVDFAGLHIAPYPPIGTRSFGLTIHPNYLGLVCVMALPTAFLWVTRSGRWRIGALSGSWRLAGLVAVAALAGGELASGSRAGAAAWVLALFGCMLLFPQLRRSIGWVLPIAGMATVLVLVFTSVGDELVEQLRFSEGDVTALGSDRERGHLFDIGVAQFSEHPVAGIGIAAIQDARNIYIQLLAATGVIGAAAFGVFLIGLLGSGWRAATGPPGPVRDAAIAASIAVLAWLANGVFDSQIGDKYLYVVPGLLLALSRVAAAVPASTEVSAEAPSDERDFRPMNRPLLRGASSAR